MNTTTECDVILQRRPCVSLPPNPQARGYAQSSFHPSLRHLQPCSDQPARRILLRPVRQLLEETAILQYQSPSSRSKLHTQDRAAAEPGEPLLWGSGGWGAPLYRIWPLKKHMPLKKNSVSPNSRFLYRKKDTCAQAAASVSGAAGSQRRTPKVCGLTARRLSSQPIMLQAGLRACVRHHRWPPATCRGWAELGVRACFAGPTP